MGCTKPVPNVPLLGAFAALCGLITLDAVQAAIGQKFSGAVAQGNIEAAREAYNLVMAAYEPVEAAAALGRPEPGVAPLGGSAVREATNVGANHHA